MGLLRGDATPRTRRPSHRSWRHQDRHRQESRPRPS